MRRRKMEQQCTASFHAAVKVRKGERGNQQFVHFYRSTAIRSDISVFYFPWSKLIFNYNNNNNNTLQELKYIIIFYLYQLNTVKNNCKIQQLVIYIGKLSKKYLARSVNKIKLEQRMKYFITCVECFWHFWRPLVDNRLYLFKKFRY